MILLMFDEICIGVLCVVVFGMFVLFGGVVVLLFVVVFSMIQVQECYFGYWYLLLLQVCFVWLCGMGVLMFDEGMCFVFGGWFVLCVVLFGCSFVDFVVDVVLDLCDQFGFGVLVCIMYVIVVSCVFNEGIGDLVVGCMQYEFGLQCVMLFVFGQNGMFGWYLVLMLFDGLLFDEGDQVFVIFSDKWFYLFFCQFGDLVGYGDVVVVLFVLCVGFVLELVVWGGVCVVVFEFGLLVMDLWVDVLVVLCDMFVLVVVCVICCVFEQVNLCVNQIDWCVLFGFDFGFVVCVVDVVLILVGVCIQYDGLGYLLLVELVVVLIWFVGVFDEGECCMVFVWDVVLYGGVVVVVVDLVGGFDVVFDIEGDV